MKIKKLHESLIDELNTLPSEKGMRKVSYELNKEYQNILNQFPIGTVLKHHIDAGEEKFTKVEDGEFGWWEHYRAPWKDIKRISEFDMAHWLAGRASITRSNIIQENIENMKVNKLNEYFIGEPDPTGELEGKARRDQYTNSQEYKEAQDLVKSFAYECREAGCPCEDYHEFAKILKDDGIVADQSLWDLYQHELNNVDESIKIFGAKAKRLTESAGPFYVTVYEETSVSGPEEGGYTNFGWEAIHSKKYPDEQRARKYLNDFIDGAEVIYNTGDMMEIKDEYGDIYKIAIESESERGHHNAPARNWTEAEFGVEFEKPFFDDEGKRLPEDPAKTKAREEEKKALEKEYLDRVAAINSWEGVLDFLKASDYDKFLKYDVANNNKEVFYDKIAEFRKDNVNESYKVKFFQVFEAPKSPKENGKMIGQRGSLEDANAFGKEKAGEGNYIIKAVCDDGQVRNIDNDTDASAYIMVESVEKKFKIGDTFEYSGLYGGSQKCEVIKVTDDYIQCKVTWTSEDDGKEVSDTSKFILDTDENGNQSAIVWEYHGEKGRVYPNQSMNESKESEESELITQYLNNGEFDKLQKVQNGTNVIWKLKESANEDIQYGIHQFSTDSIIFRGTEEECGKYIDDRKELWDDAEVYMMTPDDPHYKNLEEASYGGAFDIEDDQLFTREDIENASEEVLNHINETFEDKFIIGGTWFENGEWIVNVQTEDGMEEYEEKIKIDSRKIRNPFNDLKNKYALEIAARLISQIKRDKYGMQESLNESTTEDAQPIETDSAYGIASILNGLIVDEYEAIEGYNTAIVNAQAEGYDDIVKVLTEIQAEENIHVGQLIELMKMVDPNADKIMDGMEEGKEQLSSEPEDKPKISVMEKLYKKVIKRK